MPLSMFSERSMMQVGLQRARESKEEATPGATGQGRHPSSNGDH